MIDVTDEWVKAFGDYKPIYVDEPNTEYLYHACSLCGVEGILSNRYFFAKKIAKLKDPNEGRLSLSKLEDLELPLTENQKRILHNSLEDDKVNKLLDDFFSYVFCTSQQSNQEFFFGQFNSGGVDNGADYQIRIRTKDLQKHLWILNGKDEKDSACLRFGKIIYDSNLQKQVLKDLLSALWEPLSKDTLISDDEYKIELLIRKCYFIGTFFKKPDPSNQVSEDEQEFRVIVHTFNPNFEGMNLSNLVPAGDGKDISYIHFDDCIIDGIMAKNEELCDKLNKDPDIKAFLDKNNIVPEVWDRK